MTYSGGSNNDIDEEYYAAYKTRKDNVNANFVYTGRSVAKFDQKTSDAVWQIQRYAKSGRMEAIDWANQAQFNAVWDNRSTYYSATTPNTVSTLFDGANDQINLTDVNLTTKTAGTVYTISAWLKLTNTTGIQTFLSAGRSTNNTAFRFQARSNGTTWELLIKDDAAVGPTATHPLVIQTGLYYHFVGVRNGNTGTIYINAVAGTPVTVATGTITNDVYTIGCRRGSTSNQNFTGNIDEVTWWNTNFSAAQVTELYNLGIPSNPPDHSAAANLFAYWRMGDNDTFPTIIDSINANNGTMLNMTLASFVTDVPPT